MQLVSLGLLMVSSVVFQGSWKDWLGKKTRSSSSDDVSTNNNGTKNLTTTTSYNDKNVNSSSGGNNQRPNNILLKGVLPCLSATLLSGLAGAFSQRSLQYATQGADGTIMFHRNAYFYTIEISALSAVCLMLSMGVDCWRRSSSSSSRSRRTATAPDTSFFQHWTYATLLPITTKATAGLLTALVHRHLGSVIKGFALVLGLVFSALLQFVLEGVDLDCGQLVGTGLVLFSSWLHFKG